MAQCEARHYTDRFVWRCSRDAGHPGEWVRREPSAPEVWVPAHNFQVDGMRGTNAPE